MAQVPIWSDLRSFPYGKFRGLVSIAAAGIPCQPHSHAGKRKGGSDERFLFDDWLTGLEQMQPEFIFIENVEGLLSSKMPDGTLCIAWTVERLEGMGYRVAAGIFSASEVGAPHQRKRVFILAHRIGKGLQGHWRSGIEPIPQGREGADGYAWPSRPGEPQHGWEPPRAVANSESKRTGQRSELCGEERGSRSALPRDFEQSGEGTKLANPKSTRSPWCGKPHNQKRREKCTVNGSGVQCGPSDTSLHGTTEELADTRREQQGEGAAGTGERQVESKVGGDADGNTDWLDNAELYTSCDNRTDELRLLGNGVVPATAAKAFATLYAELKGQYVQK